jgi:hypothetical protein
MEITIVKEIWLAEDLRKLSVNQLQALRSINHGTGDSLEWRMSLQDATNYYWRVKLCVPWRSDVKNFDRFGGTIRSQKNISLSHDPFGRLPWEFAESCKHMSSRRSVIVELYLCTLFSLWVLSTVNNMHSFSPTFLQLPSKVSTTAIYSNRLPSPWCPF